MRTGLTLALLLALALAACGVKTELEPPPGATQTEKGPHDPSQPPGPLGE